MRSLDRRTRRDDGTGLLDPQTFFGDIFPSLVERHGEMAARGARFLDVKPLTLLVDGVPYRIQVSDDRLEVTSCETDDGLKVRLDAALFSDLARQLLSFNAMTVGRRIRPEGGNADDLVLWDAVWLCLLEGWPVVDDTLQFRDRHGNPLDLHARFGPDNDPRDVAHFLREVGYLHLRGWTEPDVMAEIADDIQHALPLYEPGDGRSWWATTSDGAERCVRMQHFVDRSAATARMLAGDRWQQLRATLAGDDQLVQAPVSGNIIEALVKPLGVVKGISDVPWHRDCNFGRHAYQCAGTIVGVSVTAGDADSGQLRAVAGSHRVLMPATRANENPYLPVVPLPTEPGDLTVHLACTLHEAQPPLQRERFVMYTGFGLPPRSDDPPASARAIADLRERAHKLQSQPPSPIAANANRPAGSTAVSPGLQRCRQKR